MPKKEEDYKKSKMKIEYTNPNYKMPQKLRAVLLSLGFSYAMRLSDKKQRRLLFGIAKEKLSIEYEI